MILLVLLILVAVCLAPIWIYERTTGRRSGAAVAVALVVAGGLFALWNAGSFDTVLYHAHLNRHDCARNLLTGAVFCGDELDQVRDRQRQLRRNLRDLR